MQKVLLLLVAAILLLACSSSPLNGNEVAVYADNDDLAGNEVSFETSGNNQNGEEGDDDSSHLSEQEKNRKMVEAGTKLALVIGSLISIAGGPAAAVSIGITVVSYFLTELTKEKRSLWDQIKEKVDLKIGEKLAEYHVDRLKAEVFRVLESRFQESNDFGPADLKTVLDKRHLVFPHNWPTLGWSYELPLGILYWMPFMIAGYQQMIKENKQPNCALANEMARARANIITSMKEMMRKRYQQLHGTKYSSDRVNYPCKKRKAHKSRKGLKRQRLGLKNRGLVFPNDRSDECVSIDRLLTWDDGLDGKKFTIRKRNTGWVGDSWTTKINKVRDDTVEFLWKEVVEKVNKFFDSEICLETLGCSCPTKIKKDEISFSFPRACMADGADGTCMHPCDDFDYSYEWCYINRNPDQWSYCTKPDLNDCMPVTVSPITFPNVLPKQKSNDKQ
ncbi:uncharacterized protein LOC135688939 [Rhopilema esculentum]|uniref:uncharacterized protein LOC135688939 n=1 Tax=Rhopilema esculentum TaxID=499914 RepID=UPI0031D11514|eukprot:gene7842-13719_t